MARTHRLGALYVLAAHTAMRKGELLGLHWRDVDLDHGQATVRYTLSPRDRRLGEPKTAASEATVPLSETVVAALRAHRQAQLEERLAAGPAWQEHGLVFTTTRGTAIAAGNLTRGFHRLLKRAGLPRVRFHDLRHGTATQLVEHGEDLVVVQQLLRHSSMAITAGLYIHALPARKRTAANRIEQLLASASGT